MNYIDIIIIFILAASILLGFIHGFVKEAAAFAALVLGIWGAIKFSSFTAQKLYDFFDISGQYTGIAAFIITFVIIVIAIHFIGIVVNKFVKVMALGLLNRILGAVFGIIKSALILSVIFSILNAVDAKKPFLPKRKIEQSALYYPISDIVPAIFPIIGEGTFNQSFDRFKKSSEEVLI